MHVDKELMVSDSQVVTVSAASTETIDQGAKGDLYNNLFLNVQVRAAATAAGAATVNFLVQTDDDSAFGSAVTIYDSGAVALAGMALNAQPVKVRLPYGAKRYIRGYYTVGTGPLLTGKFDMFFTESVDMK